MCTAIRRLGRRGKGVGGLKKMMDMECYQMWLITVQEGSDSGKKWYRKYFSSLLFNYRLLCFFFHLSKNNIGGWSPVTGLILPARLLLEAPLWFTKKKKVAFEFDPSVNPTRTSPIPKSRSLHYYLFNHQHLSFAFFKKKSLIFFFFHIKTEIARGPWTEKQKDFCKRYYLPSSR